MSYILIGVLLLALAFCAFYKMKFSSDADGFFSKGYTNAIKGISSFLVIMVHIPKEYGNQAQNIIGSFAMIGVSFFFLISAYGLKWSVDKKEDYLKGFWKKRLFSLLTPWVLVNIISALFEVLKPQKKLEIVIKALFSLNTYVNVIIVIYFCFYIIYKFLNIEKKHKDFLLCAVIVLLSLITELTNLKIFSHWGVESLGFAVGIITYNNFNQIKRFMVSKYFLKTAVFTFVTIVLGILYLKFKSNYFFGDYVLRFLLNLMAIITVYFVTFKMIFNNKLISFLGNISYEMYLSHFFIIALIERFTDAFNFMGTEYFIIMVYIITIFISAIIKFADKRIIKIFSY